MHEAIIVPHGVPSYILLIHCKNKSVVVTPNLGVKVLCTYDTLMGCHGP